MGDFFEYLKEIWKKRRRENHAGSAGAGRRERLGGGWGKELRWRNKNDDAFLP